MTVRISGQAVVRICNYNDVHFSSLAVYVGFQKAEYSIEEGSADSLTILIVRQDNLTSVQGFNISLRLSPLSSAIAGTQSELPCPECMLVN